METSLDRQGRVLIPEELRKELGWKPGRMLRARLQAGRVVLEPIQAELLDAEPMSPPGILAQQIEIHVDGGARGNPGAAACAFVVHDGEAEIHRYGEFLGTATNNEAEYRGLIAALEWLERNNLRGALVLMDSNLVIQQVLGFWKIKSENLKELNRTARRLFELTRPRLQHVPRERNADADREVNRVLDQA